MEAVDGLGDWLLEDGDAEHFDMYELGEPITHLAWTSTSTLAVCLRRDSGHICGEVLHVRIPEAVVSDPDPEAALTLDERDIEILQGGYPSGRISSIAYLAETETGGWLAACTVPVASSSVGDPSSHTVSPPAQVCFWPLQSARSHGHGHGHGNQGHGCDNSAIREEFFWRPLDPDSEALPGRGYRLLALPRADAGDQPSGAHSSRANHQLLAFAFEKATCSGDVGVGAGVLQVDVAGRSAECIWRAEARTGSSDAALPATASASATVTALCRGSDERRLLVATNDGTLFEFEIGGASAPMSQRSLLSRDVHLEARKSLASFALQGDHAAFTLLGDASLFLRNTHDWSREALVLHLLDESAGGDVDMVPVEDRSGPNPATLRSLGVHFSPIHEGLIAVSGEGERGGLIRIYDIRKCLLPAHAAAPAHDSSSSSSLSAASAHSSSPPPPLLSAHTISACHTHRAHEVEGDRVTALLWHEARRPGLLISADTIGSVHVWKWKVV